MFGFFNKKDTLKAGMQAVNLLALGAATYDLLTNPQAKGSELGMDMAIHALSYLTLRENSDVITRFIGSGFNMFRIGAIYSAVNAGVSSVPLAANLADVAVHLINAVVPIVTDYDEEDVRPKMS